ncbi:hypothetical protein KP509_04G031700 [Ceratopteris richardii]|nr:hypothetical protein KP509_04G031700 [Ceratopteris richardii]
MMSEGCGSTISFQEKKAEIETHARVVVEDVNSLLKEEHEFRTDIMAGVSNSRNTELRGNGKDISSEILDVQNDQRSDKLHECKDTHSSGMDVVRDATKENLRKAEDTTSGRTMYDKVKQKVAEASNGSGYEPDLARSMKDKSGK